jgi:4-amino-4-deoxy-L-arabinose transferase-like glycosyltransferase
MDDVDANVSWKDYLPVGLYSLILFGFAGFSGRPLTMHEARLPQTSREMLWHHEWLLPTSGGRPWLERPPLPHWVLITFMKLLGHDDRVWIVRLPSALMGVLTVLVTMSIAGRCFGRTAAVLTGSVLATSLKFYQYACLAEDDIYLAALLAIAAAFFAHAELGANQKPVRWYGFVGGRSWAILGFFAALGLSNLTKGPLLGIVILGAPVGVFLLIRSVTTRSFQPLLRYFWLWGWLVLIGLTIAWPWWAKRQVPDVVENWKYDYLGRMYGYYTAIDEPWWYYPPKLFLGLLPWAPFCLLGLAPAVVITITTVFRKRAKRLMAQSAELSPDSRAALDYPTPGNQTWLERAKKQALYMSKGYLFTVCWALVPLIVLSIPKGKHDHYLVPFLAPWAMLGTLGLIEFSRVFSVGRKSYIAAMILLLPGFCVAEALIAPGTDHTVDDTAFLLRCRNEVPAAAPLFINAKLGPVGNLDFFRMQFYSRPNARLIHNLSFLRDESITAPVVYVITRQRDERLLAQLGSFRDVDHSPVSHEISTPDGRYTLFCLTFAPQLHRYPLPAKVSSLQAMERAPGPWCGPPMP